MQPFCSFVPSYGTPLGFLVASDARLNTDRTVADIDAILRNNISGNGTSLKAIDGQSFRSVFGLPLYVRKAIAEETVVYE